MIDRLNRRDLLRASALAMASSWSAGQAPLLAAVTSAGALPNEPIEIGREPQFLFDHYLVDTTWALNEKREVVRRVFHQAVKRGDGPVIAADMPSYVWAARDDGNGLFRMWYQMNQRVGAPAPGERQFGTFICYAESTDGLNWTRPALELFPPAAYDTLPRNAVLYRPDAPEAESCAPQIVDLPERDRRGYRYVMLYHGKGRAGQYRGIRAVGSHDGVQWDMASDTLLSHIPSDHPNTVVYDAQRDEYVMYLRAKDIYLTGWQRGGGETIVEGWPSERLNTGQSRRSVARMTSKSFWTEWTGQPQSIISPDEIDFQTHFNLFYGMPVRRFAGIYWGFLLPFRLNDYIYSELAWSRDGVQFARMPSRDKLIEYGPDGSWDDTMIFASPGWVEVGDEWWIYYTGWDGPHGTPERNGGIGVASVRKEGFISLRGPRGGGVVCTRRLRWPGGNLAVNANASDGELRVRVSDGQRRPIADYDYTQCAAVAGDGVSQIVRWNGKSLDALRGRELRLEFYLKDADLYTFRAHPMA